MNRKGQLEIGNLILIAIVAIVGLILLTGSAQNMHNFRNTVTLSNTTLVSTNGTRSLPGQAQTSVVIYNGSGNVLIGSGNYSVSNYNVTDGSLTSSITIAAGALYQGESWNLSSVYEPDGYSTSSAARSMGQIILIFFGFGIAIVMLVPTLRSKILEKINR